MLTALCNPCCSAYTIPHLPAASATSVAPVHASLHLLHPRMPYLKAVRIASQHLKSTNKMGKSHLVLIIPNSLACSFYDFDAPIYTMSRFLPPSKVADAEISDSILGDGTVIRAGCNIKHSVIGLRTLINENCTVEDALVSHSVKTCCWFRLSIAVLSFSQQQWRAHCWMAACSASSCL